MTRLFLIGFMLVAAPLAADQVRLRVVGVDQSGGSGTFSETWTIEDTGLIATGYVFCQPGASTCDEAHQLAVGETLRIGDEVAQIHVRNTWPGRAGRRAPCCAYRTQDW